MRRSESIAFVFLVCAGIAFWMVNVQLGEGGCARIIPGSLALIVLCLGSLAFKRWRSATICLITMIGCIWYREITAPRWNGRADRDARLTIHGRDLRAQDQIAVAWVPAFVGDSKEITWKPGDWRDGSGQEFTSRAHLTCIGQAITVDAMSSPQPPLRVSLLDQLQHGTRQTAPPPRVVSSRP